MSVVLAGVAGVAGLVTGCGGGGSDSSAAAPADTKAVVVKVDGEKVAEVAYGKYGTTYIHARQSVEIEALSAVQWVVYVDGIYVPGFGKKINFPNFSVNETTKAEVTPVWSAQTAASAPLTSSAFFTVTAGTDPETAVTIVVSN